jgi:hypothetical protein
MNPFTNYLEKLGNNFLVSAMVPSLALVVACLFIFNPILHTVDTFRKLEETPQLIGFGLLLFLLTVLIGFTLTALNTYILKIFEGYVTFPPLRFLYQKSLRIHQHKACDLMTHRDNLEKEYWHLKKYSGENNPSLDERLAIVRDKHYQIAKDYDEWYPAHIDDILPTSFGNTLRAAEDHAMQRYGFDGVTFWPRLVQVIPDGYKATIDNTRNELSFLVNMSILSVTFSLLCILAIFHAMWTTSVISSDALVFSTFAVFTIRYLVAAAFGMISCGIFYRASIISLGSFALTIRSSFDLFRLDLLRKLEVVHPTDFEEECKTWTNINELILLGNRSLTFQNIKYRPENNLENKQNKQDFNGFEKGYPPSR